MNLEIITILDRSGSMAGLRNDIIGGYNTFLAEQKTLPGNARITLVQFSSEIEEVYTAVPIHHIGNLTLGSYITAGNTALYDTIGAVLTKQGARIGGESWADKVLLNIITDGEENASKTVKKADALQMIAHKQDKLGWTVLFQASGIEAFKEAANLGIRPEFSRQFTANAAGVTEAYGTMSAMATSLRSGASPFEAVASISSLDKGAKAA